MNAPVKRHWLDGIEQTVANLCLASLVLILAAQVFFRYVLSIGLSWSEEVSRFLLVWFVYVSASLAAQKGTHIRVTVLTGWFPGGQRACLLLADALWIFFNGVVVVAGVLLIRQMLQHPVYSTSLFLPMVWIYTVIPLAHGLMIYRIVARQWRAWRHDEPVINDTHAAGPPSKPPAASATPGRST
ncbi:MAG: TRAP transporter small permease [Burkholderiaceae bacterium]|nr:TRAP transporter small permease [Burkholderiaceae bacterium]